MKSVRVSVSAAAVVLAMAMAAGAADEAKKPAATTQPVDFRKLKEVLPAEMAGIKRTEANGQKLKTGDFAMSMATGTYEKEGDGENLPRVEVILTDYVGAPGMGEGMAHWAKMEIDQETDDMKQKTLKVNGHPALMTYNTGDKSATWQIWVENRFLVHVATSNLTEEQGQKAVESLPLAKLKDLK